MASAGGARVPLRVQCAVYGIGGCSTTMHFMAMTIVPLWVVQLELSPIWLGLVLGCRPVLPLFLSIHVGALLDRLGARRVMLIFAILGMLAPLLYPALPWIWAIVVAQLLWGLADTTSWIGAQALVGKLMEGRTVYAGRLSFVSRIANVMGPLLVGAAWDAWGPTGAFVLCFVWGIGGLAAVLALPDLPPPARGDRPQPGPHRGRSGLRALLPEISDYRDAFRLAALPTVAITLAMGMMNHVGGNIQGTFYVVWLDQAGRSGTLIGALISIANLAAGIGALFAASLARVFKAYWLLWFVVWASIVLICITPLFGTFVAFAMVLALRSLISGVHQPLVMALMLNTVGTDAQGRAIGLRSTANRITAIGAPVAMGGIAEVIGIEASFYVMGVIASLAMVAMAAWMTRHPEIHRAAREV
ncbi:MAG: MFS transporter [Alphaproteobacteria bacterium]|nr:MFS transporter [Alphaproteobacteria bacterium]